MFDKDYPNRKDHRKPYYSNRKNSRAKVFDHSCRNHRSCKYCQEQRLFFDKKKRSAAEDDLKIFLKGED